MAEPIRPGGQKADPCEKCGAAVRVEVQTLPRKFMQPVAETRDVRVCTNPECETNGSRRGLFESP